MSSTVPRLRTFSDGQGRRPRRAPVGSSGAALEAPWPSPGTERRREATAHSRNHDPLPRPAPPNRSQSPSRPACSARCPASANEASSATRNTCYDSSTLSYSLVAICVRSSMSICNHVYRSVGSTLTCSSPSLGIYIRCCLGRGCQKQSIIPSPFLPPQRLHTDTSFRRYHSAEAQTSILGNNSEQQVCVVSGYTNRRT